MFKEKISRFFSKNQPVQLNKQDNGNKMVVLQSNSLGFSVVEEQLAQTQILTNQEWQIILKQGNLKGFSHGRIYFNFLKGIPNQIRLKVWLLLSCPTSLQVNTEEHYKKYLECNLDPIEQNQINVDLKRTYGNILDYEFTSPVIKRILSAASIYKHSYTQGMNYILIYLLIFGMQSQNIKQLSQITTKFESQIFSVFVGILDQMQRIFGHNLINFLDVMKQLQILLTNTMPQLLFSIANMGFDVTSLLSQNYFSLMMYVAPPFELAKMILDLFQLQGHKAIHAILVRMLQLCSNQLMKQKSPQKFQKIIKSDIFKICGERFIKQKETAANIQDFGICIFEKTSL